MTLRLQTPHTQAIPYWLPEGCSPQVSLPAGISGTAMPAERGPCVAVLPSIKDFANHVLPGVRRYLIGKAWQDKQLLKAQHQLEADVFMQIVVQSAVMEPHALAVELAAYVRDLFSLQAQTAAALRICLVEGLANALEHGNLELTAQKRQLLDTEGKFDAYEALVHQRQQKQPYAERLITIAIEAHGDNLSMSIEDEGSGFDTDATLQEFSHPRTDTLSGRGVSMLHKLPARTRYSNGGRKLIFTFQLPERADVKITGGMRDIRRHSRILVVDDQEANRKVVRQMYRQHGLYQITEAADGRTALAAASQNPPDLILLDVMMPGMDGFAVCRALKQNPHTEHIPVIFLTALDDFEKQTQGYEAGAVDYIAKPVHSRQLIARSEVHLKNRLLMRQMESYARRVRTDLEQAHLFQQELLPVEDEMASIRRRYGIELNALLSASEELSGDYWTLTPVDDNRFNLLLIDFTGHGMVSALNTVRLHALVLELDALKASPAAFMSALNKRLNRLLRPEHFATATLAQVDVSTRELRFVGCGSPPFAHYQVATGSIALHSCAGIPLGVREEGRVQERMIKWQTGDKLLFYSDALVETLGKDGRCWQQLSPANWQDKLTRTAEARGTWLHNLLHTFEHYIAAKPTDDLTMVELKF